MYSCLSPADAVLCKERTWSCGLQVRHHWLTEWLHPPCLLQLLMMPTWIICVRARVRGNRRLRRVRALCCQLGRVLTDEVTPSSLIMQRLVRVRRSLSRSHCPPLRARVGGAGTSTGLGMRRTNQTPLHVKHTFPPSLSYFPPFTDARFVSPPLLLMKLARLGSPSVEKQTQARCLPLMFPAGRPYSISIQQTNI